MTQEEKELLLKDMSARLPYGVKAYVKNWSKLDQKYYEDIYDVKSVFPSLNEVHVQSKSGSVDVILGYYDYDIKPYLFPMSSMTEEQMEELIKLINTGQNDNNEFMRSLCRIEFYHINHFDYRGLIPMGLANDATGLNIY